MSVSTTPEGQIRHVLLMTNSEYGQANTFIALAHALAIQPNVNVHFASFIDAESRVIGLKDALQATGTLGAGSMITFHNVDGPSVKMVAVDSLKSWSIDHPPGFWGALKSYSVVTTHIFSWTPEQYMMGVNSAIRIIEDIDPAAIVIDTAFSQGIDGCRKSGRKYIAAGPMSLKDTVLTLQPRFLANYSIMASGYQYPLQWSQVVPNIILTLSLTYNLLTCPRMKLINDTRKAFGLDGMLPLFGGFQKDVEYLAPMIPELDFPLTVIPQNITLCGPFILPVTHTVAHNDAELAQWLKDSNGRTILVNLGTHAIVNTTNTRELAKAFSAVIQHERIHGRSLQILWKLQLVPGSEVDEILKEELGSEIKIGIVRVVDWLAVDPIAILQQGNIICSIHHGGANSFFEGIMTGTPHIVLPRWYDCYDYANRVEYLHVGIYGNRTAAPDTNSEELTTAVIKIIASGSEYITRAKQLAALCQGKCGGRELGAKRILKAAEEMLSRVHI
ncbi:hypothetical protein BDQ12DRAFT_653145 [Crucibulum laeve]|uniref:Erythromycin biosynthesis protein CIII-like C-terminal domain-containing protein n=1 Tax=Crucibulum laeve TaxID=68775 RepID=A0A5C3LXW2_9AGAR|nr:hypothetical protein BDQ12DRAFT_653145 [Crucibulum laeve]